MIFLKSLRLAECFIVPKIEGGTAGWPDVETDRRGGSVYFEFVLPNPLLVGTCNAV